MTTPPQRSARRAVVPLLRVVLAVETLRIVVAVIAGIAASSRHFPGAPPGVNAGEGGPQRLLQFAGAGDCPGALLMLLAAALLWIVTMLRRDDRPEGLDFSATMWLTVLTGVSAVLSAVGYLWAASSSDYFPVDEEIQIVGGTIVVALAMVATAVVVRGMQVVAAESVALADDEEGAAVFAVDRKTGAVLAWASQAEAREKAPLYGVEDDEYEWFLDDGVVLHATADGDDVSFTPTGDERPDDLLRSLKDYVERRGLTIDEEEADEPLAYVDPIARDHYLEMWPGWLRWLGRLTR